MITQLGPQGAEESTYVFHAKNLGLAGHVPVCAPVSNLYFTVTSVSGTVKALH